MPPVTNRKPAAELLRLALPLLLQYGIPPTPRNYAVWYEYVAESNQPLRQAIDEIIGQGGEFNDDINADLYQTYLASDKEKEINKILLSSISLR